MYSGGLMTFGEMELVRAQNRSEDLFLHPEVRVRRYRSRITFEFDLTEFDSIEVQCKRGKESDFIFLGESSDSHYSDIRPDQLNHTEIRHYKFYYLKDGIKHPEPVEMRIRTVGKFIFF